MKVLVIGGGIGGVSAALGLSRAGVDVEVIEQAEELKEIGAGLQMAANAMKAIQHWGLEDDVAAVGVAAQSILFRDLATGGELFSTPLGAEAEDRYGAPFHQIHRADLLDILVRALPPDTVRLGSRVMRFEQDEHGVVVHLDSGEELRADALVGADGIKSTIREQLLEPAPPRFTGVLGWRAIVPGVTPETAPFGRSCYAYLGPERSMVLYWLKSGTVLSMVGFVPADEVHRESWTQSGDVEDFRRSFAGTAPEVEALVNAVDSAFITGVYDRDPLPRWTEGRVTLLGDAAHPFAPYLAQGACQAIEDAAVLAGVLGRCAPADVPRALAEYESLRRARTTKGQVVARAAERFWHETDPVQIAARNGRFRGIARIDPLTETVWSWLYDYDPIATAYGRSARATGVATAHADHRLERPEAQRVYELWRDALTPADYAGGWRGLRAGYDRFLRQTCPVAPDVTVEEVDAGGVRALWVDPPVDGRSPAGGSRADAGSRAGGGSRAGDGRVVVYLHGGGFMLGSADAGVELASRLASALGGRALAVDYRLAPEHAYPAALDDALAAYRWLVDQGVPPAQVLLAGDSAGGALAVATALRARDEGLPSPAGVYAMSPLADLALTSPSIDEREGTDPAVNRDLLTDMSGSYLQGHEPTDPHASPVYADFADAPALLVHAAAGEALLDDARRLVERARAAGADARLRVFADTVHAFPLFAGAPDTAEALAELGRFAHEVLGLPASAAEDGVAATV